MNNIAFIQIKLYVKLKIKQIYLDILYKLSISNWI